MRVSVVALNLIVDSASDAGLEFNGTFDPEGNPVLVKPTIDRQPGTVFEMDEDSPDFAPFIACEAIRLATPQEIERGHALSI